MTYRGICHECAASCKLTNADVDQAQAEGVILVCDKCDSTLELLSMDLFKGDAK